jgi:hypothetical protein
VADSNIDVETAEGHLNQSTTLSRSSYIFPREFLLSLLRFNFCIFSKVWDVSIDSNTDGMMASSRILVAATYKSPL